MGNNQSLYDNGKSDVIRRLLAIMALFCNKDGAGDYCLAVFVLSVPTQVLP